MARDQMIVQKIEAVLDDINSEVENRCGQHLEFWHSMEKRLLNEGELSVANPPFAETCLRLQTEAIYNQEEDEFEAKTCYSHSPNADPGELDKVSKEVKRLFGFLSLRAVGTGSRALKTRDRRVVKHNSQNKYPVLL